MVVTSEVLAKSVLVKKSKSVLVKKWPNRWRHYLAADSRGSKNHVLDGGHNRINPFDVVRVDKSAMRPFAKLIWTLLHRLFNFYLLYTCIPVSLFTPAQHRVHWDYYSTSDHRVKLTNFWRRNDEYSFILQLSYLSNIATCSSSTKSPLSHKQATHSQIHNRYYTVAQKSTPHKWNILSQRVDGSHGSKVFTTVCLCASVFPHNISQLGSANFIRKRSTMSPGNPIILGSKSQRSRSQVTKSASATPAV